MVKRPRFEVYESTRAAKGGPPVTEWRWRLIAANGRILASGQAHTCKADAERAVVTVKAAASKA